MSESTRRIAPRAVAVARGILVAVAVAHAVVILALLLLQDPLADSIGESQPTLSVGEVRALVSLELIRSISFHALLVVVCGVYAAKIGSGSRRVLRVVIASQALSVVFGAASAITAPDVVRWSVPPFIAAALLILALLVGPAASRAFFADPLRR